MKRALFKGVLILSFLLITFFSIINNSHAASFAYSDFDWEEFSEENKNYWTSFCYNGDPDCRDEVLATKKRFYTQLYKLLTQFQREHGYIDDNIIIATLFYGLDGEKFRDPLDGLYNPYNLDDGEGSSTLFSFVGNLGNSIVEAVQYFLGEKDSLKTLINNFKGYWSNCYAVTDETPMTGKDSNNEPYYYCSTGSVYDSERNKCIKVINKYKTTMYERLGFSLFLGNDNEKKCEDDATENGYSDNFLAVSDIEQVSEDFFWYFLENEDFLDKREHLKNYYVGVLQKAKKNKMSDLTDDEKLLYRDDIIRVRQRIIRGIKQVVARYRDLSNEYRFVNSSNQYWWPIGSDTEYTDGDRVMAPDEPPASMVTSRFGPRWGRQHRGIDIDTIGNTTEGKTNIIASKDGIVVYSTKSAGLDCYDSRYDSCGGGYGNHVVVQHADGNYTMYAHLYHGSVLVETGDDVKQGQVLGKMGDSGRSKGYHLHFEIRVGENSASATQNPLNYVDVNNPRPSSGDIVIPEEYGNSGFFTYTIITRMAWKGNQKKVYNAWINTGAKSEEGIATIDGRYLIACTTTFGNVGDKIDFYLEDGTKLETIMMDAKAQEVCAQDSNPANMWGHNDGQQIIEFEITAPKNGLGDVGSWMGWSGKRVASATNLGENILGNPSGGIKSNKDTVNPSKNNSGSVYGKAKYIDGVLIVNKTYPLPEDYAPTDTYTPINGQTECKTCIDKTTYQQFKKMQTDASKKGLNLYISSGYRSYTYQDSIYNGYVKRDGKTLADTYSARPGNSEHQTGLAFDLNEINDAFAKTSAGKWVNKNCYKYGFIIRYPNGKQGITGYKYEPWHLRYVGVDLATELYNNGNWITLEEHFNITSKYPS